MQPSLCIVFGASKRSMLDTASPRFSETGEYLGYIGSVIDIQVRKEAEEALRAAKEAAENASREKDKFLAQLSHELRTPLAPVLMAAAALREDETLPPAIRRELGMIHRNVALDPRAKGYPRAKGSRRFLLVRRVAVMVQVAAKRGGLSELEPSRQPADAGTGATTKLVCQFKLP
jgi:signal transduction histidine kinase